MRETKVETHNFKTTYRLFLSDITPGCLIILLILFFGENTLLINSGKEEKIMIYAILFLLTAPLGLIVSVCGYLSLNRLTNLIMKKFFIIFIKISDEFSSNKEVWAYFRNNKNQLDELLFSLYFLSKIILGSEKMSLVKDRIDRIRGLQILCRSFSFIFSIFSLCAILRIFGGDFLFLYFLGTSFFFIILSSFLCFSYYNELLSYALLAYFAIKKSDWKTLSAEKDEMLLNLKSTFLEYEQKMNVS